MFVGQSPFSREKTLNNWCGEPMKNEDVPWKLVVGRWTFAFGAKRVYFQSELLVFVRVNPGVHSHRIHVWYIYLQLVHFCGKCRWICHTWILWEWTPSFRCQDTIFYIQQAVQLNTCTKHVRYGPYNYLTGVGGNWNQGEEKGWFQERMKGKEGDTARKINIEPENHGFQ